MIVRSVISIIFGLFFYWVWLDFPDYFKNTFSNIFMLVSPIFIGFFYDEEFAQTLSVGFGLMLIAYIFDLLPHSTLGHVLFWGLIVLPFSVYMLD